MGGLGQSKDESRKLRTFLAIPLSRPAREKLWDLARSLNAGIERHRGSVKLVKPESMHMTLKFLGDVDRALVPEICSEVGKAVEAVQPFSYTLSGIGFFGAPSRPRVLFVKASEGAKDLEALAKLVEQACLRLGFEAEARPFKPHLTLARFKRPPRRPLPALLGGTGHDISLVQAVDRVILYKSDLTPKGAFYEELGVMTLAGV